MLDENDTLVGAYPLNSSSSGGASFNWAVLDVSQSNSRELYLEFWARMPDAKQGFKFIKVFGGNSSGYANVTVAADYNVSDRGSITAVSFGDGTELTNDTAQVIRLDGSYPQWIGRSYGTAVVATPQYKNFSSADWGQGWHYFRFHVAFNSGTTQATEQADGKFFLEIDDKTYVDGSKLFNRHFSNDFIERVELFGWAQNVESAFEIQYRDIYVSTVGFRDSPVRPNPPQILN